MELSYQIIILSILMLIYVLGFVGLIVLLGGVFNLYTFKYGLFGAIIIWFISGAAKRYYS